MESVAGSLLEREREEELLARVRDSARAGEGALVLVEGPAGIGKSSLLARATRCAREEGMAVAFARGSSLERGFSFGVALQLFGPLLGSEGPEGRAALLSGAARGAAPLLDPESGPGAAAAGDHSIFGLLHGLYWLTAGLGERRPLLIAIDDGHWSDEPSLRFVHYLAQRIDGLPVALALAVRTGEPESGAGALTAIRAHPGAAIL